ncbi:MAG: Ig-like domain-containing protein [Aeromicrobium sp.]|uniref:L,D-transpeptidase n=1 Tax=Aeromicrobium sp. TaxID=1871063 RepID=UPI0039E4AAB3
MNNKLWMAALASVLVASGCSGGSSSSEGEDDGATPAVVTSNVTDGQSDVPVETVVTVDVADGEIGDVTLTADDGSVIAGAPVVEGGDEEETPAAATQWVADDRLEPGLGYTLVATAIGDDGKDVTTTQTFTTRSLTLDEQTFPSVSPLADATVGVGMPVVVNFDLPVTDRATFERNMHVTSEPEQVGSWNWISDNVAQWRPQEYWQAGTKVHVDIDVNSLPAGNGIYGQESNVFDFTVGDAVVATVDISGYSMSVNVNGEVVKTLPVTTGDATHQTRIGTKIIMEKYESIDMDAATTGVDSSEPGYYNIADVRWAMRLTNSGEFIHAAPWSVGSQGNANVSHGCTGLSLENSRWLFEQMKIGDVVEYVNGSRPLEANNGWTAWNVSWEEWAAGSALVGEGDAPQA